MSELGVVGAARGGDIEHLQSLLASGGDVNQKDEHGWTALNWAAGRGDVAMVQCLLDLGADLSLCGPDNRRPLAIAKAAGRTEVVTLLTKAEKQRGIWQDPRRTRAFCKAYLLSELQRFPAFLSKTAGEPRETNGAGVSAAEGAEGKDGNSPVVYLHQDLTVTRSMWHGEDVIWSDSSPEWKQFCEGELAFAIPDDLL